MPMISLATAWLPTLLCMAGLLAAAPLSAEKLGGFTLDGLTVDRALLVDGGPGKDGIQSVDDPQFADVAEATWLGRDTEVLGVEVAGEARAYPLRMLEFHQIVNDVVGGVPIAVTYDPLAGTPAVYRRDVGGEVLELGVSGLLYNHNFLMHDRKTESLWSQAIGEAVAGPLAGERLERIPVRQETARSWLSRNMDSRVLRPPFPEKVHYQLSPYTDYWVKDELIAPVAARDPRYHAKELVLGVIVGDTERAYLGSVLTAAGGSVDDEIAGKRVQVHYDTETGTFRWEVDEGVKVAEAYWLAWKAFHPDTQIWGDAKPAADAASAPEPPGTGSGEPAPAPPPAHEDAP